jgi:hypothetical protein
MPCERVPFAPGITAVVCRRGGRARPCAACGKPSERLCDYPDRRKPARSCSLPLCKGCTTTMAGGADFCPEHAAEWNARRTR